MSDKQIKKRNRPDLMEQTDPGDNSKYIRHALATLKLPPIDIADPVQVNDRIHWYFEHCITNDMKPTVKGFCNALGVHRDTIHAWKTGEYRAGTHQAIILNAYNLLEDMWEIYMLNGKINPVVGIFLGKNNFNYVDKQEHILTPNQQSLTADDVRIIESKYEELPEE